MAGALESTLASPAPAPLLAPPSRPRPSPRLRQLLVVRSNAPLLLTLVTPLIILISVSLVPSRGTFQEIAIYLPAPVFAYG